MGKQKKILSLAVLSIFLNIIFYGERNISLANVINQQNINESKFLPDKNQEDELKLDEYILGPGDFVEIAFVNNEELSIKTRVFNNGSIHLPLIGSVNIEGMTFSEAKNIIEEKLSAEISFPLIHLTLIESRPVNVSVLGEVNNPGFYSFSKENSINTITSKEEVDVLTTTGSYSLVSAIQKAGGITLDANIRDVTIFRKLPKSQGNYKEARLNLYALIFDGNHYQNPLLFDGDIIKVHKAKRIIKEDLLDIATSNLSPSTIKVNIIGEVNEPGEIKMPANTLLMKGILMAQGIIDTRANIKDVQIIRINRNGSASFKKYKLDFSNKLSSDNNPQLKNGDVVKVGTKNRVKTFDLITQVTDPFTRLAQLFWLYKVND